MSFLTAKSTIESTQIFNIVKKMPKGALLHAHLEATVDAGFLLKSALEHTNVCIRAASTITKETLGSTLPDFAPRPVAGSYESPATITSPNYVPDTYVSAQKVRREWPEILGGPEGFDRWVIQSLTINPSEAYDTHNTTVKIWNKFQSCFTVIRGLLAYEPVLRKFLRQLFESCVEDGISYAEFRWNFTPKDNILTSEDGTCYIDHDRLLSIFQTELELYLQNLRDAGRSDLFHGAKIIYTFVRIISVEELEWYLEDCLALKKKYPQLIAGFDVVGPEDVMHPLIYYLEPLIKFRNKCEALGIDLPFLFHAGETLGDGNSTDQNLYDAILLGTKRIGHAFSLIKHPTLMRLCRERNICCEVCPVSNEILRLTASIPAHPIAAMLNHGVPIALASDDPGIFSNIGLSYDFFQVLVSSEISGLMTLAVLARESFQHAILDEEEKKRALAVWDARWARYIEEVVSTNGIL
ncbi:hypothetical protein M408DRAFT_314007 [Serendipita vermifera MAFF 305830]|uniref:adenosine deaminase n=1 Tax=Serendipita vermifera MAFF 305830 TaxID=933852 RepID=A0A0C2WHY3_SERVB|nr:hypothetical protein M408DRAFT_314007 [Serendipita vermifera MAFF 305830]